MGRQGVERRQGLGGGKGIGRQVTIGGTGKGEVEKWGGKGGVIDRA